jgi:hypothetical protein
MKKTLSGIDPNIWLILALSIFAWGPLLTPAYFFNAHDAKHSVFFLVEFDQTFRDGYWWPRWSPDFAFGYGYPLFNLYAPLAFYAAEILHLLGLGFTAAVKTMYIWAAIGAGLGMYGLARRLYGPAAGVLAAVVYMYAPFHLVEIFVRSAYAEFVALALIPFLFWAFTELIAAPSPRRLALAGLAYGLLALTHHTSFFTFTPLLIVYILYLIAVKIISNPQSLISSLLHTTAAGLLGLALAAIYLIPMLGEVRFIKLEQWTSGSYNYLQHFVYFSQFFAPDWGYGYSGVGLLDGFSFQLGIVAVVLFVFALVLSLIHKYPHRNTAFFFMGATLVTIFIMSPLAETLWQILPIASLVQFPWRLLAVTAFTMSIAAGALISIINTQRVADARQGAHSYQLSTINYQLPLLCLVVILGSFTYTLPQYTEIPAWAETPLAVINWDRASIVDRVGMVSVTEEQPQSSPMEAQYLAGEPLTTAGIIAGEGRVEILHHGGASDQIKVTANRPVTVQFYTYDYPGWQVTLNGKTIPYRPEPPFGLITVDIPAGEHILWLQMGSTPPRTFGTLASLLAAVTIIGLLVAAFRHSPKLTIPQSTP